VTEWLL